MKSDLDSQLHHQILHHKMKDSFASTYLTVLSIMQGVALTDLVSVVATQYQQFTIIHWLLVIVSFCVLIIVLNVYTMQSIIWDWIPDLRDAVIVFTFGGLELFLNHTIIASTSIWLVGLAGMTTMGMLGTWHIDWRAGKEADNEIMLSFLQSHHRLFAHYLLGNTVILLLLAVVSHMKGLEAMECVKDVKGIVTLGMIFLVYICMGGAVVIATQYWSKAVEYARTGRGPGKGHADDSVAQENAVTPHATHL